MIPNAALQHRMKQFDQLLERELAFLQRGHEQNVITYEKFEKSIQRESNHIGTLKRKKLPTAPTDNDWNILNEQAPSSSTTSTNVDSESPIDENFSQVIPKYHRNCFKGRRLPPIVKFTRQKRTKNQLHWIGDLRPANIENEVFTLIDDELPKLPLPESTLQKRMHAFMETLPPIRSIQNGFDNFAAAALLSHRAPAVMK